MRILSFESMLGLHKFGKKNEQDRRMGWGKFLEMDMS